MYDRRETADAYDRLWKLMRDRLPMEMGLPQRLTRDIDDLDAHWCDPGLVISQTCSLPFRTGLSDAVQLVATPVLALDYDPGFYNSIIVERKGAPPREGGMRAAYNSADSQSGWAALEEYRESQGLTWAKTLKTGSHQASARGVALGRADIAAIDALSWHQAKTWDGYTRSLKVVGTTSPQPALPYICAKGLDAAEIREALAGALRAIEPEHRAALGVIGLTDIPAERYLEMPPPPAAPAA